MFSERRRAAIGQFYTDAQFSDPALFEAPYQEIRLELISIDGMKIDWGVWAWEIPLKSAGYMHRCCAEPPLLCRPVCVDKPTVCS